MSLTRKQIQEKIDFFKDLYTGQPNSYIKEQMEAWFDTFDLGNLIFTHDQVKQRLLDDLASYQGMEENG